MQTIWIYLLLFISVSASNDVEVTRATYCYGDSSGTNVNLIDISCSTGNIFIHDVIAASKPSSLSCPEHDHDYTPAERLSCCSYTSTDCSKSFAGSWENFIKCNGRATCFGVPIIRDEPVCSSATFPRYSNHMVLEFYCMPVGYNYGPCNTTEDCNDPAAMCDTSFCACQDGYTTFRAFDDCWKDGGLNGSCTGAVGCQDANTVCNYTSERCECDVGYVAYEGQCVQGGHNFGFCVDTADCTDPQALCDQSVCTCMDGYTAFVSFDDCWEDGGLNGSCNTFTGCHDNHTLCDTITSRCTCVDGYSPTDNVCYPDGKLNGYCQIDDDCIDPGLECVSNRCICSHSFKKIDGTCQEDGRLNGFCDNVNTTCVDKNSTCESGICKCTTDLTEVNGECKKFGENGGPCDSDNDCTDVNAECASIVSDPQMTICQCIASYSNIEGICKKDRYPGGICDTDNTCIDPNSECRTMLNDAAVATCQCVDGYTDINGTCMQDGELGGLCMTDSDCTDPIAKCVTSTTNPNLSICECINGYSNINGICIEDGDLGGLCTTNDDCADTNAECIVMGSIPGIAICQCVDGYTNINGTCMEDGELGGRCTVNSDCTDTNAECVTLESNQAVAVCTCVSGFTNINEICIKDGELEGRCSADVECTDLYAECVPSQLNSGVTVCNCISGHTNINGTCIKDGDTGGVCLMNNVCTDPYAQCLSGMCVCINGYTNIGGICIEDGDVGGVCLTDGDCMESNTECITSSVNPALTTCQCLNGYTDINRVCIKDGENGGFCKRDSESTDSTDTVDTAADAAAGTECVDSNAQCVKLQSNNDISICECKKKYTDIGGVCIKDGTFDGFCNGTIFCKSMNTVCNAATQRCECSPGSVPYNGQCYTDGELHGSCSVDADCIDSNAECRDQRCKCIVDYSDINGVCQEDGHLGGYCEVTVDCIDDNAVCSEGVCTCIEDFTGIEGSCKKDRDLGGACNVTLDPSDQCTDGNAECNSVSSVSVSICECSLNYTNIDGICEEDRRLGGRCTAENTCVDSSTECSIDGICICIEGYSEVNGMCKEDRKEGGVCGLDSNGQGYCSETNTECHEDSQMQCAGSNCEPGVCQCLSGYNIGRPGSCTKDGDIGGICNFDRDCVDSNANCIGDPLYCYCSTGYRDVDGICIKDGDPGGYCILGHICTDPHSICVNGTCICNDVRNYIQDGSICRRNETFIYGECGSGSDVCQDVNAECSGGKCVCIDGYSQENGRCTESDFSSVTSCNGSSPYNQLVPDCDLNAEAVVTETYQRVKPASATCPTTVDIYSEAAFTNCCSYADGDCRLEGAGADVCTQNDLIGDYTTYTVVEYICAKENSVVDLGGNTNAGATNNQVYITFPVSEIGTLPIDKVCSVTASCQTDIDVYMVFYDRSQIGTHCSQTLTIIDGADTTIFNCDTSTGSTLNPVYGTSSGFFIFRVTNPDQGGSFVLEIIARTGTADVEVACGNQAVTEGPSSFRECGPLSGRLGGSCSSSVNCTDSFTVCRNGICVCKSGYKRAKRACKLIVTEEDSKSDNNALLAVVIPVAALVALAIAGVAFWLLKNKLRNTCNPKQEAGLLNGPSVEPSPFNTKFPGRGVPSDVGTPKHMPLPWIKSAGWSPMNQKFHGNLPSLDESSTGMPRRLPPLKSMNGNANTYMKNSIEPIETLTNVETVGNDLAGASNAGNIKPKPKKNKLLKKPKFGRQATQSFDLPTMPNNVAEGMYTPNQNFYGNMPQQMPNDPPVFSQTTHPSVLETRSNFGRLPPLSATVHGAQTSANGNMQAFDPMSAWRTVGAVTSVAVQPNLRRPSVLDIHSVDDPSVVERTNVGI